MFLIQYLTGVDIALRLNQLTKPSKILKQILWQTKMDQEVWKVKRFLRKSSNQINAIELM